MRRQVLTQVIPHALIIDVLIGFITYWLQPFDERFSWVFLASVIILVWLCVVEVFLFLEFLTEDDES